MKIITLLDVLIKLEPELEKCDSISEKSFTKYGMPMEGNCCICGESISAFNASPGKNGYIFGKCCATESNTLNMDEAVDHYCFF